MGRGESVIKQDGEEGEKKKKGGGKDRRVQQTLYRVTESEIKSKLLGMSEVIPDRLKESVVASCICFPGNQIFYLANGVHFTGPFSKGWGIRFTPPFCL